MPDRVVAAISRTSSLASSSMAHTMACTAGTAWARQAQHGHGTAQRELCLRTAAAEQGGASPRNRLCWCLLPNAAAVASAAAAAPAAALNDVHGTNSSTDAWQLPAASQPTHLYPRGALWTQQEDVPAAEQRRQWPHELNRQTLRRRRPAEEKGKQQHRAWQGRYAAGRGSPPT